MRSEQGKLSAAGSKLKFMFDNLQLADRVVGDLDAEATLTRVGDLKALAKSVDVALLEAAAHWADLHAVLEGLAAKVPGAERLVVLGGLGTPEVAEFAPAEFAARAGMSVFSGTTLITDALDLRHRLPLLWARARAGEVEVWVARKVAALSRPLDVRGAALVDRRVAPYAGSLSWGRLEPVVLAAVVAADPEAARAAAEAAASEQGVWLQPSTEAGTKTLFARAQAPVLIWFDAACQRVADALALTGDTRDVQQRRAAALAVIIEPDKMSELFERAARIAAATDLSDLSEITAEPVDRPHSAADCAEVAVVATVGRRRRGGPSCTVYGVAASRLADQTSDVVCACRRGVPRLPR